MKKEKIFVPELELSKNISIKPSADPIKSGAIHINPGASHPGRNDPPGPGSKLPDFPRPVNRTGLGTFSTIQKTSDISVTPYIDSVPTPFDKTFRLTLRFTKDPQSSATFRGNRVGLRSRITKDKP